jgi:hypothetical protein
MQLASTLFAFVVLQIKPQLEKLLKLPADSLVKEIRLTQDLQELFMKYQIPSDLLSYDGDPKASEEEKLSEVKKNVKAMQDMIEETRQKELADQQQANLYNYGKAVPKDVGVIYTASDLGHHPRYRESTTHQGKKKMKTGVKHSADEQKEEYDDESSEEEGEDYTQIPELLDARFEELDAEGSLRPTIIGPSDSWSKQSLPSLLATPVTRSLGRHELESEKNSAFDLIDALSRSGCLPFDQASLHVVLGATHCFDKTITDTVIQDNVNPVEKLERSLLIIGTTILEKPAKELIKREHLEAVEAYSRLVFDSPVPTVAGLLESGKEKEKVM